MGCHDEMPCGIIRLMENTKLIYPEECYAIRGAIFEVYHELGNGYRALGLLTKTVLVLKDAW